VSKEYTQKTAALKTVVHDTRILNAYKILFSPNNTSPDTRVDLASAFDNINTAISTVSTIVNSVGSSVESLGSQLSTATSELNAVINEHANNTIIHISEAEHLALSNIISNADDYARKTQNNVFTKNIEFAGPVISQASSSVTIGNNFSALPLNKKTALGADAYGLHVSSSGGLQLWGTHFMQGDEWSDNALKIVHNNLALFGNYQTPCSLTFDNANIVNFRVMPDDGSAANNGQGAIFDFAAWQWDNDSHTTKNANCPVQILKNDSGSLTGRSLMNMNEMDNRYVTLSNLSSNYYSKSETENNFYNKTASDDRYLKLNGDSQSLRGNTLTVYNETQIF
jgi:hypothetical protein